MKVLYGAFALLVFIYLAYTVYAAIGAWMCAQVEKKKEAVASAKAATSTRNMSEYKESITQCQTICNTQI